MGMPNPEKKVDESWKEQIETERTNKDAGSAPTDKQEASAKPEEAAEENAQPGGVDFSVFLSTLGMQALVALGELENPSDGQKNVNLPQAKYMIDLMALIQEKTKGNLNTQEDRMLTTVLYELRMKYVEKSKA